MDPDWSKYSEYYEWGDKKYSTRRLMYTEWLQHKFYLGCRTGIYAVLWLRCCMYILDALIDKKEIVNGD